MGQYKVSERTLEVKAGDLFFILGNLSNNLLQSCTFCMMSQENTVTCCPSWNKPGGTNKALSVTAMRGTKVRAAQTSGFTAKHFIFRWHFELFSGTNIPSIITAALSNTFTVEYLKRSSCLTAFFFFFLHCEMEQINVKDYLWILNYNVSHENITAFIISVFVSRQTSSLISQG